MLEHERYAPVPVCSLNASYIDAQVLPLLHCDHLRCWLKAELLHHGFKVVLSRTLRREKNVIMPNRKTYTSARKQKNIYIS